MQSGLRSRRYPWANLNNRVLHLAYLEQIGARYDLTDELSPFKHDKSQLSTSEKIYDDCEFLIYSDSVFSDACRPDPDVILRTPYKAGHKPDNITRKRVAGYISAAIGRARKNIEPLLPDIMPRWGKMRVVDGDRIRSVCACGEEPDEQNHRDMSFVRVRFFLSNLA
jgi:hypothetical protein